MRPYTSLVSSVVFPLHERLKGHRSVARRVELEHSQWWTAAELKQYQWTRLRGFLQDVHDNVPYYRGLFSQRDLHPRQLADLSELASYPLLTKSLIRANIERLKAGNPGALKRYNTGGSSGEPLIFFMGKDRIAHDVAAKWRATRWWDVDIGDPEIVVWGSPVELGAQDRMRAIRDALLRSELLPAFEMSEEKLDRFVDRIRARRPAMLFGYPSSLSLIAAHAKRRRVAMDKLGIRVAFVTSERLYDHQRQNIESVFGCRVANGYGGRDCGFIAHDCPAGSMHISAEDIIIEIIDAEGRNVPEGASGEIVVTHLATRDFPFLRYRTGDIGVLSTAPCSCGRGLPVISEIQGRNTDFVIAVNGTVMHGLALIYVVRDLPGIERFKIVQETLSRTRVLLEPGPGYDTAIQARIRKGLQDRLGSDVEIVVECVNELGAERSGKFRYVISHVASEALAA